ncbi:MAG: cysteine desulfurase NifS [Omnitrophica bacterium RIFCSPHIGHO2_02_FULL_46_11]|nr:MAG: cysteine desulfurase NifS [Omnitrophica bacterium RIFCSPHIGHO2_02_FULL_46_11]
MIYLDNNATTKVAPEVKQTMDPFFCDDYGNPSALYDFGTRTRRVVEESRKDVAQLLGAKTEREIMFTSGGTESNHTAIYSALKARPNRKHIVTSQVEHSSIRNLCQVLSQEGYKIISVGVSKDGALNWEEFEAALTDDVAIVSIMWANNETGVLFPIERIAALVKQKGILFHTDAIQAIGKIPINLAQIPVDYLSFSAHKFHGPKGIGALYVREGTPFAPLFFGGRQERDRRAGTENVPGIVGLNCALQLAVRALDQEPFRIANLRDQLEHELITKIPESFMNGKQSQRIPNTTNITIPGIEAEAFLIRLNQKGIAASSGSACLTGALEPSHVLQAMGHSEELAFSSLRFSLSRYTTAEDIEAAIRIIPSLVDELRKLNQKGKLVYGSSSH